MLLAVAAAGSLSCKSSSGSPGDADLIRATERQRLRALVEANVDVARQLHADDFQLINPRDETFSKDQYLGGIASGEFDYLVWEPESIEVRVYGEGAVIRYRSQLEIVFHGQKVTLRRYWHTDSYQKRNGRWQVASRHLGSTSIGSYVRLGAAFAAGLVLSFLLWLFLRLKKRFLANKKQAKP